MKKHTVHPACLAFPMLPELELEALAEDIKHQGLLHPIVTWHGQILDGRNRLAACEMAGVPPRFVAWDGHGSPTEWVIATNLFRRHLTASQRAVVALDILPMLEQEAKERQRHSPGRGKKVAHTDATFSGNGKASQAAARLTRSSSRYVEAVKAISTSAPDLVDKIRGGQLTVPDARRLALLPKQERKKVLRLVNGKPIANGDLKRLINRVRIEGRHQRAEDFRKANGTGSNQNILIGDMSQLWKRLEDNSVSLFLTDPPYSDMSAFERLAELAAAKLKPGGLCLAYSGHFRLPDVLAAMGRHLTYWWTFAIQTAGQPKAIQARHVQCRWKPIVAFCKPPSQPAADWLSDLVDGGGRDKTYHAWGQAEAEAAYLIQRLTEPAALVVDCYAGGGTVLAAAKATGRHWLATEVDKDTVMIARKRLAEMK